MTAPATGSGPLGKSEILALMGAANDPLFMDGTGERWQVGNASYDLRLARAPGPDDPLATSADDPPFILKPGAAEAVATVERIAMPWNRVGHMAPKFSTVRRGLLVLAGGVVDPGYGYAQDKQGGWYCKPAPLYFLVVNVSTQEVVLSPGKDSLIRLQLFPVEEPQLNERVPVEGGGAIVDEFDRDGAKVRLGVFQEIEALRKEVEQVENRSHNLVTLGVLVLAFALVGAVVAAFAEILTSDATAPVSQNLEAIGNSTAGWLVLLLAILAVVFTICLFVSRAFRRGPHTGPVARWRQARSRRKALGSAAESARVQALEKRVAYLEEMHTAGCN